MGYRITIVVGAGEKDRVTGYPTTSPHVWVTRRSCGKFHKFSLTHRPSGRAIFKDLASLDIAELAWGIAKLFPINWSLKQPDPGKYAVVLRAVGKALKEVA